MLFFINVHANDVGTANVNVFLGQKALDEDEWGQFDKQGEVGVLIDFKLQNDYVSTAIDLLGSLEEITVSGEKFEGSTGEIDVGVRKIWKVMGSSMRTYIGGGLAYIQAELKSINGSFISDDDDGFGIWLNGGVYWIIGQNINLGIDLRYSQADVTLFGIERDAGGNHAGIFVGYHWK